MKTLFNLLVALTVVLLGYGFCQAIFIAPTEATMGDVQRIFYYHLPSAWVAFLLFFVNFLASVWYLVRRTPAADALALASAEVGVSFCTIVLLTGPIWARPIWGIWWTWDARLTSTLVLWLIYVSYLVLRHYATGGQVPVLAAALGIFGFVDVPIVYMAIRWFRTQHPQPVIGGGQGSGLDPRMWTAVLWNLAAFAMLALLFVWIRYRQALAEHALEEAHAQNSLDHDSTDNDSLNYRTEGAQ
jgi:heme exporter protein C